MLLLTGMNAYERAREERIASNRARLAELNLPGMASKFVDTHLAKPKRPSKPRGLAAKRQKKVSYQLIIVATSPLSLTLLPMQRATALAHAVQDQSVCSTSVAALCMRGLHGAMLREQ